MTLPYVADRAAALDALHLLDTLGTGASAQAGARARLSRDRGNVVSFCRWRQIERLLTVLEGDDVALTRH